ncbi:class I SAM-dependent methyltransferase [Paenibacillus qinlingensis]|uniref:class I SAM-dependent methyltransferase n=1 Tax=Paenibacillus qinlingensis TaxID=1837343 RepID=UPI001565A7F5|nr:class I SAM-dependent methyltransferase [Paenibacillus qinlingensis]NQX58402.1 class I SAM-dependent methyltransferase [Paenibacillus qinlingensis]
MKDKSSYNTEMAQAYETNARISIPTYDALFGMVQSYFRAEISGEAASVLVVGAGGGQELSTWGPANPEWRFTGVDISAEMLKIAQHKTNQLDMANRVNLIHGTITDLPEADAAFDAASCILVLHFIDNVQEKLELLRSIHERMKPGAPFVLVSAYGDREGTELKDRLHVWRSFWLEAGRSTSIVNEMVNTGIMKISFLPEKQIEGLLQDSGFTHITKFFVTGLFGGWICQAGSNGADIECEV